MDLHHVTSARPLFSPAPLPSLSCCLMATCKRVLLKRLAADDRLCSQGFGRLIRPRYFLRVVEKVNQNEARMYYSGVYSFNSLLIASACYSTSAFETSHNSMQSPIAKSKAA